MQCETCGAAFDSKGRCTVCGARMPKSKGYVVGHSILCCILIVLLTFSILTVGIIRSAINSSFLTDTIEKVNLSTLPVGAFVDNTGNAKMTLSEYLYDEYVTDKKITVDDVTAMVDSLAAEQLLQDKTEAYLALLRGESDEMVSVSPDEVISLLEKNKQNIYNTLKISIDDADKTAITEKLDKPMQHWNNQVEFCYGSRLSRTLSRFRYSLPCFLLLVGLLLFVVVRWCVVYRRGRRRAPQGLRAASITILVCSSLYLIGGIASLICSAALADNFSTYIDLIHGVGVPLTLFGGIGVMVSIFLIILACLLLMLKPKAAPVTDEASRIDKSPVMEEVQSAQAQPSSDLSGLFGLPPAKDGQADDLPYSLPVCPSCGIQANRPTQKFCMKCGGALSTPDVKSDAPMVSLAKAEAPPDSTPTDAQ